jgi:hypothetical protein
MGRTACTEPQCLYSRAIPLLPLWAVRPVQSLSACTSACIYIYIYIDNRSQNVTIFYKKEFDISLKLREKNGRVNRIVKSYEIVSLVDWQIASDVSERYAASIFKVGSPTYFNCWTLKMKSIAFYRTSAAIFYPTESKIYKKVNFHQY